MCDLLWSDPQPQVSFHLFSTSSGPSGWINPALFDGATFIPEELYIYFPLPLFLLQNGRSISKRGVSCQFGPDVTERFLKQNNLDFIVRSHEVKAEGYEVTHSGKCITVFSAPNYWYVLDLENCKVLS